MLKGLEYLGPKYQDYKLSVFLESLEDVPMPENTNIIDSYSNNGWPFGTYCQSFVYIVIETNLDYPEIYDYFNKYSKTLDYPYSDSDFIIYFYVLQFEENSLFYVYKSCKARMGEEDGSHISSNCREGEPFREEGFLNISLPNILSHQGKDIKVDNNKNYFIIVAEDGVFQSNVILGCFF